MPNSVKLISQDDNTAVIAGYGVVFGGNDLEGENFTKDTDFMLDLVGKKLVFYDHTLQPEIKHTLGHVISEKIDEFGIFIEAQIDIHKKYVKEVLKLIDEGILGWSSGSIGHLIEREGKSIKRWPIVEFSLTPTPAEPRTLGVERLKALAMEHPELKALLPKETGEVSESAAKDETAKIVIPTIKKTSETKKMAEITISMEEYKDLLKSQLKATPDAPPASPELTPEMKALNARMDFLTEKIENSPVLKDAGYVAPDSETDHADSKSFADFLVAVKNNNMKRIRDVYKTGLDPDEKPSKGTKTALAEDAGATGGYLVPIQYAPAIVAAARPFSVLRQAGATIIPMSGKTLQVPALDIETAPSAGDTAYAGGVIAYWTEEAAVKTESEPRFRLIELTAHKLAGYSLASDEVVADGSGLEAILTTTFGRAIGSKENYAFLRGDGVGKPLGIMESGALITPTRSAADTVALVDLSQMMSDFMPSSWGKGCWIINPEVMDNLVQLVSAPLAWLPNLQADISTLRLLGMPVYVSGALPAQGITGDIMLVDPSYYLIGDRQGISVSYSEHYRFIYDQGTWRFTCRVDGQPWIEHSITLEDGATTVSPFVVLSTSTA